MSLEPIHPKITKTLFDKRLDKLLWPIFTDPWCRMTMVKDIGLMVMKCKTKNCKRYKDFTSNLKSLHITSEKKVIEMDRYCWSCGEQPYCEICSNSYKCEGCDISMCDKCPQRFPEEILFKITKCVVCYNNYCGNCTTFTFTDKCGYCIEEEN